MENQKQYFVLWKRDMDAEKFKKTNGRMIYDGITEVGNYNDALVLANNSLPSILAKYTPLREKEKDKIRDVKKPYIVSAFFPYKYSHTCYDGSTSYNPTNEVIRSSEKELERVVEQFKTENAEKIRVGIELKVLGGTLL